MQSISFIYEQLYLFDFFKKSILESIYFQIFMVLKRNFHKFACKTDLYSNYTAKIFILFVVSRFIAPAILIRGNN